MQRAREKPPVQRDIKGEKKIQGDRFPNPNHRGGKKKKVLGTVGYVPGGKASATCRGNRTGPEGRREEKRKAPDQKKRRGNEQSPGWERRHNPMQTVAGVEKAGNWGREMKYYCSLLMPGGSGSVGKQKKTLSPLRGNILGAIRENGH